MGVAVGVGVGVGVRVGSGVGVGSRVGAGVGATVGVGVAVGPDVGLGVGPGGLVAAGGSVTAGAGVPGAVTSPEAPGLVGSLGLDPDGVPLGPALAPGSRPEPSGPIDGPAEPDGSALAIGAGLGPNALEGGRAGARNAAPMMIAAISAGSIDMAMRRIDRG